MTPQANQIYKHFKGNLYRIVTVAEHTESGEQLVIYQALYGDFRVFARPLSMFMEEVDSKKYPDVKQKMRFELVEEIVQSVPVIQEGNTETLREESVNVAATESRREEEKVEQETEEMTLDPLLEQYLDTDSYREKLNVLHGLHHRITEHMLTTMAVVIDFELPEGDIEAKYNALKDCLLTKEKYECNRMV